MVGLSVVLESHHHHNKKTSTTPPQVVINKHSSSFSSNSAFEKPITFLELCFLCNKLLPGNDIYMYKGDKAFCSEECRWKQIFMDDEEEAIHRDNCSLAAMIPKSTTTSSHHHKKGHHKKGAR